MFYHKKNRFLIVIHLTIAFFFITHPMEKELENCVGQKRKQIDSDKRVVKRRRTEQLALREESIDEKKSSADETNLLVTPNIEYKEEVYPEEYSDLKNMEQLSKRGLTECMPVEILLYIFSIDFNNYLNQNISSNNVLLNDRAKYFLKKIINHINKYLSIDKIWRQTILRYLNSSFIPKLVEKFGYAKFCEIAIMPKLFADYFYKMFQESDFRNNTLQTSNLISSNFSWYSTLKDDTRPHPTAGAHIYGFIIRICDDCELFKKIVFELEKKRLVNQKFADSDVDKILNIWNSNGSFWAQVGICFNTQELNQKNYLTPLMYAIFNNRKKIASHFLSFKECNPENTFTEISEQNFLSGSLEACHAVFPYKMEKNTNCGGRDKCHQYKNVNLFSLARTKKMMDILIKAGIEKKVRCLEVFIKHAELDAIKYYLENILPISEKNNIYKHCFVLAAKLGRLDLIHYLLSEDLIAESLDEIPLQAYALISAAKYNYIEIVQYLLNYTISKLAENNFIDNPVISYANTRGITALMVAANHGFYKIVKLLLKYGAGDDINDLNQKGQHILNLAIDGINNLDPLKVFDFDDKKKEYEKIIRLLQLNGADPYLSTQEQDADGSDLDRYPNG